MFPTSLMGRKPTACDAAVGRRDAEIEGLAGGVRELAGLPCPADERGAIEEVAHHLVTGERGVFVVALDEPGTLAPELRRLGIPLRVLGRGPGLDLDLVMRGRG